MSKAFHEYFRLTGQSFAIAERLHEENEDALNEWSKFLSECGAKSAMRNIAGRMVSVLFETRDDAKTGWREIGEEEEGIEYAPHRGTKAGRALAVKIENLPRVPIFKEALKRIDRDLGSARQFKNRTMLIPTCSRLSLPKVSYLASIPRAIDDDLSIPDDFVAITEREYTLAFHEHNLAALKEQEAQAND